MFPPHRSGSVRSAKTPVTKTCSQCGAVLASSVRACTFCDSSFSKEGSWSEDPISGTAGTVGVSSGNLPAEDAAAWRGELALRMAAYRARHRKPGHNSAQSRLPFDAPPLEPQRSSVALADVPVAAEDFAFTIAIGRTSAPAEARDARMEIDVSAPPVPRATQAHSVANAESEQYGVYPVASLDERRWAACIDAAC